MDQNKKTALPSISQLLQTSWHTFTESLLSLFLLNILGTVVYLGVAALGVVLVIISGAGSLIVKAASGGAAAVLPFITSSTIIFTIVIAVVLSLIYIIVCAALQISSILLVSSNGKEPLMKAFKKSFGFIIPLFLVNILVFVLSFGALFVFILPAILFSILLMFVQLEVILNNQKWLSAIKRSVLLVTEHFGAIFIRIFVLWLIYAGIFIIGNVLQVILPSNSKWIFSLIYFVVNLLLGWYSIAYQINLYFEAKKRAEGEKGIGIAWMWVIAIIGWIIAIALGYVGYKTISSGILNQLTKPANQFNEQTTAPYLPPEVKDIYSSTPGLF